MRMGIIMSKLLILGAGQYGGVAREIAESIGDYDAISFLDDNSTTAIGTLSDYDKYSDEYDMAIAAIGSSEIRAEFIAKLESAGYVVPVLIHPRAYVAPSAVIDKGTIVEPMAIIHTDVKVGAGCIISAGTIINHNAVVGNVCHLNCGTIICARTIVDDSTKTDCGQIIE